MASMGIDLGTTYTCAGVIKNGKVEIIQSETGANTVPSNVAFFRDGSEVVGEAAKLHIVEDPEYCLYNVKRLIGRQFDEPAVQTILKNLPFKVVDESGKLQIKIPQGKGFQCFHPEQISGKVLKKMKERAEQYLGKKIVSAVITIPQHFNRKQREATRVAADYAKLHLLQLVNEPTAVAIAYGLKNATRKPQNVVVYDLGGGTFDVSVVEVKGKIIVVKGTAGDRNLGGEDFDVLMMNSCIQKIRKQHGKNIGENEKAKCRLKQACRRHKEKLSLDTRTTLDLKNLLPGMNFSATFTRAEFEHMNKDNFDKTIEKLQEALDQAKMSKDDIDVVLLAGGSTKIPYVWKIVEEYFEKRPHADINPDEAIARGATLLAAELSADSYNEVKHLELHDITPLSLGIRSKGNVMSFVVPRGTETPSTKCRRFQTVEDNQTAMTLAIYEGERADTELNNFMASFALENLPPKPAGEAKVLVTFKVDNSGILEVSARDVETENEKQYRMNWSCTGISQDDVDKQVKEAESSKKLDDEWRRNKDACSELGSYARKVKRLANTDRVRARMPRDDREDIIADCDEILEWIEEKPVATVEDIRRKLTQLQNAFRQYEQ